MLTRLRQAGIDPEEIGRIVERDVRRVAELHETRISPVARKLAGELGVDVEQLAASVRGRRIHYDARRTVCQGCAEVASEARVRRRWRQRHVLSGQALRQPATASG